MYRHIKDNSMALQVNEIFYSIQGESIYMGLPFVFVRLSGCNLRCTYCDTQYAYSEGDVYSIDQLIEKIAAFGCRRIALTGGEPLLQDDTPLLATRLLDAGHRVVAETNGSMDIGRLDARCSRVMDIKCPSSGVHLHNNPVNMARLTPYDQVKFVIGNRDDYDFAKTLLGALPSHLSEDRILFSTVAGKLTPAELARWILADHLSVRLQVQLHKIIWPEQDRGV
ncbi:radical SAM protein [Desulfosarcina sp. OttesenSCG-928-A07]|nr:radical SAM protein [Desulfosarcina sp. OttesenSCG-928-G17]MDL2330068.1 radical SAM protein [Desulfosarcina sp. OttesenSCG-928-A07]